MHMAGIVTSDAVTSEWECDASGPIQLHQTRYVLLTKQQKKNSLDFSQYVDKNLNKQNQTEFSFYFILFAAKI